MANPIEAAGRFGYDDDRDIEELLRHNNPNPARVGCPPRDVLAELARQERPLEDPAYDHLIECSPCYREFKELQASTVEPATGSVRSFAKRLVPAAAAVLIIAAGLWFALSRGQDEAGQAQPAAQVGEINVELDLRPFTVERGEPRDVERPSLSLPRSLVNLTLLLPVGSEPGLYEVAIVDSERRSRATGQGVAEIRDYVTTLEANLDLREVPPGAYQLGLRRHDEGWHTFPVDVT